MGKPPARPTRQLPAPIDGDPKPTDSLRKLEQELGEAAMHGFQDTETMARLIGPEFTQRMSDAPAAQSRPNLWGKARSDN